MHLHRILVIDGRIEIEILDRFLKRVFRADLERPVAVPMVRGRAAAVRDNQLEGRTGVENIRSAQFLARQNINHQIVRTVERAGRVAGRTGVNHARYVQFDQLFPKSKFSGPVQKPTSD